MCNAGDDIADGRSAAARRPLPGADQAAAPHATAPRHPPPATARNSPRNSRNSQRHSRRNSVGCRVGGRCHDLWSGRSAGAAAAGAPAKCGARAGSCRAATVAVRRAAATQPGGGRCRHVSHLHRIHNHPWDCGKWRGSAWRGAEGSALVRSSGGGALTQHPRGAARAAAAAAAALRVHTHSHPGAPAAHTIFRQRHRPFNRAPAPIRAVGSTWSCVVAAWVTEAAASRTPQGCGPCRQVPVAGTPPPEAHG